MLRLDNRICKREGHSLLPLDYKMHKEETWDHPEKCCFDFFGVTDGFGGFEVCTYLGCKDMFKSSANFSVFDFTFSVQSMLVI